MRTVLKSNDGWYTIAIQGSLFFLCVYNPQTEKYKRLHEYGTYYHVALNLDRSIIWDISDDTLTQYDFFAIVDNPTPQTPIVVYKRGFIARIAQFISNLVQ